MYDFELPKREKVWAEHKLYGQGFLTPLQLQWLLVYSLPEIEGKQHGDRCFVRIPNLKKADTEKLSENQAVAVRKEVFEVREFLRGESTFLRWVYLGEIVMD